MTSTKHTLQIETGATPLEITQALQNIKDAMVQAMMLKIDATGLQDAQDCHYTIWQSIYLQAHFELTQAPTNNLLQSANG